MIANVQFTAVYVWVWFVGFVVAICLEVCLYLWLSYRCDKQPKTVLISGIAVDVDDAKRYAGQWVAFDSETGELLVGDPLPGGLKATMRERFLGRMYVMIQFPEQAT